MGQIGPPEETTFNKEVESTQESISKVIFSWLSTLQKTEGGRGVNLVLTSRTGQRTKTINSNTNQGLGMVIVTDHILIPFQRRLRKV